MYERIEIKPVWNANELVADGSWLYELSSREVGDFSVALARAKSSGKSMFSLSRSDFPFGAAAQAALNAVTDGTQAEFGLKQLRGFPVAEHSDTDMRLLWWGVGLYLGVPRPQGKESQFISDVTNLSGDFRSGTGRGYHTKSTLDFHSDTCDVVGLFCLRTAKSGGTSLISSSVAAHNQMLAERPDLVEVLYSPFFFSRQGEHAPEEPPYYESSVFSVRDGRFACRHLLSHIRGAQLNFPEVPRLTPIQIEALEYLDKTLAREDLCFHTYLQPGDMQFVNNHVVLHSRTEFEDFPDPALKRHLLRLWLAMPSAQALPTSWAAGYKDSEARSVRGGFRGLRITEEIMSFERRLAKEHGMSFRIYEDLERFVRLGKRMVAAQTT